MFSFQLKQLRASWIELQRLDDQELIPGILAGDHDAFAVLVDRYQRLVFSVALRIVKNAAEAEDVVQNVFADIFRKAAHFDPSRGTLKVWILQYAYSRAINHRHWLEQRHFYSQTGVDEINPLGFAAGFTRSEDLSTPEASRLVGQAIRSLKPRQQQAISLVYFEGLTLEEAAERTGDTLAAMRHNYYRGLMKLRQFIGCRKAAAAAKAANPQAAEKEALEVANLKPRTV
jgi:RNA polymerase sigma-70 factor (ECF subfamily)